MERIKTGGRKVGTPNRVTSTTKEIITKILDFNLETVQADLDSMEPVDRVKCIISLARLVVPSQVEAQVQTQSHEMPVPIFQHQKL